MRVRLVRRPSLSAALALAVGLVLAAPGTALAHSVPAGDDYFHTVAAATYQDFSSTPIPAGFFDPGSDAFAGTIQFQGVPLDAPTSNADTIVRRFEDAHLRGRPSTDRVPIELIALHLQSVQPITVTYSGQNPEQWTVDVHLSNVHPSIGKMDITHLNQHGGTFDSRLNVYPLLTFTRQSDAAVRNLDFGAMGTAILFTSSDVRWVHRSEDATIQAPTRFCASCSKAGGLESVEQALYAAHGVVPATLAP